MQARLEWIETEKVIPNTKNPRKNHAIKTEEMQEIIRSKGWEEGITCYQDNGFYVVLSGHRRLYAAKQMGEEKIPVFIVEAPKDDAEELDRLGSVQGGQVEWSPYELAEYTYKIWEMNKELSYNELAKKLEITKSLVKARIRVYRYYKKEDIEDKLRNGMYSITMLDYIYSWIVKLKKYHPTLVDSLTEDNIKLLMLKKFENKCFNSQIANDKVFVNQATTKEIESFLTDFTKKLSECQMEMTKKQQMLQKDPVQNSMEIAAIVDELRTMEWKDRKQANKLSEQFEKLRLEVDKKIEYLSAIELS